MRSYPHVETSKITIETTIIRPPQTREKNAEYPMNIPRVVYEPCLCILATCARAGGMSSSDAIITPRSLDLFEIGGIVCRWPESGGLCELCDISAPSANVKCLCETKGKSAEKWGVRLSFFYAVGASSAVNVRV